MEDDAGAGAALMLMYQAALSKQQAQESKHLLDPEQQYFFNTYGDPRLYEIENSLLKQLGSGDADHVFEKKVELQNMLANDYLNDLKNMVDSVRRENADLRSKLEQKQKQN